MITQKRRELSIAGEFDVVICGSGPAGVAAAIASARAGARTCVIESNGCLGGVWTSGLLAWIIDYQNKGGILLELVDELIKMSGDNRMPATGNFPFNGEDMKILLERKCLEAGVHVRLHTRVVDASVEAGRILQLITESKSGRESWIAKNFVDASGDGDLGAFAGCEFEIGNERGVTQPMSLLCILTGISLNDVKDMTNGYSGWLEATECLKKEMNRSGVEPSYGRPSLFHLCDDLFLMMANHQYNVLGISAGDLTTATISAREEVHQQVQALRSLGGRWAKLRVVATAEHIGVREGRRVRGLYTLSIDDLLRGARFDDAVCTCEFGVDVHATEPSKGKGIESHGKYQSQPYDIPLRSLISKDVSNLLMAGRCISGDFLAHSSYRVTGDASPTGEAAGICAALAAQRGEAPRNVACQDVLNRLN